VDKGNRLQQKTAQEIEKFIQHEH